MSRRSLNFKICFRYPCSLSILCEHVGNRCHRYPSKGWRWKPDSSTHCTCAGKSGSSTSSSCTRCLGYCDSYCDWYFDISTWRYGTCSKNSRNSECGSKSGFFRTTALEEGDDSQTQLVKILNSLHNVSFSQLLIQESMMRGQILAVRAQEGHAKLIVNSIQKLVDSFQRIAPSQTAGTLEEFGNSFGSLADTLKDLFSGQRLKNPWLKIRGVESWQSSLRARTFLSTYGPILRT